MKNAKLFLDLYNITLVNLKLFKSFKNLSIDKVQFKLSYLPQVNRGVRKNSSFFLLVV